VTDEYRTWETISHVLDEKNAANRLAQHWHGSCVTTSQFAPFDRVLMHPLGGVAAVVEIKVRTYPLEYFAAHRFMLSYHKVKTLKAIAKQRSCVALIMVACKDDDFVIDLRDETGMTIERRKIDQILEVVFLHFKRASDRLCKLSIQERSIASRKISLTVQ